MSVTAYRSNTARRIFTGQPFKRGMMYEDVTLHEGVSRTIVNLDISSNGEYANPRPAFINAVMDNFYELIKDYPTDLIQQSTSLNRSFLIGFEQTVSEEEYLHDAIDTDTALKKPFGLDILQIDRDFQERMRRDGIFKIHSVITVYDGDTYKLRIYKDEEEEQVEEITVRLLGMDTPELNNEHPHLDPEPFADAAQNMAHIALTFSHTGDFAIGPQYNFVNRYIQFDPATVSTDRTDSERTLAHVLIEVNKEGTEGTTIYTLAEFLLKTGYGKAQLGENYLYYDRLKAADTYAKERKKGIHFVWDDTPPPMPDLPTLQKPVLMNAENPGDPITIEYDDSNPEDPHFKMSVRLHNPNKHGEDVLYQFWAGTMVYKSGVLSDDEEIDFNFRVYQNADYSLRARFIPTKADHNTGLPLYNVSPWETVSLAPINLDLNPETINTQAEAPFEILEHIKHGFEFRISNNLEIPIDVTIVIGEDSPYSGTLYPGDVVENEYTNEDWPLFESHNKSIELTYQPSHLFGPTDSVIVYDSVSLSGYRPQLGLVSQNADEDKITVEVNNRNFFSTNVKFYVDGDLASGLISVSPGKSDIEIGPYPGEGFGGFPEGSYEVIAVFRDTEEPYDESDDSPVLHVTVQRLYTPSFVNVEHDHSSISAAISHTNSENIDAVVYLEDDNGNPVDSVTVTNLPPDTTSGPVEFTDLNHGETYKISVMGVSKTENYSDSTVSSPTTLTLGYPSYTVRFYTYDQQGHSKGDFYDTQITEHENLTEGQLPVSELQQELEKEYLEDYGIDPEDIVWEVWESNAWVSLSLPYTITGATDVRAILLDRYQVTFFTFAGDENMQSFYPVEGQTITEGDVDDPTKENHEFDGWFTDETFETEFDFNTEITEETVIYAKWTPLYTVQFIVDEDPYSFVHDVRHGDTIVAPEEDPDVEGHRFDGWFHDEECTQPFNFEEDEITENTYIYAKLVEQVTATFYCVFDEEYQEVLGPFDEGTTLVADEGSPNEPYVEGEPENVIGSLPTREGYFLSLWRREVNGSWQSVDFVQGFEMTDNIYFRAHWEANPPMKAPDVVQTSSTHTSVEWTITQNDDDPANIDYRINNGSWTRLSTNVAKNETRTHEVSGLGPDEQVTIDVRVTDAAGIRLNSTTVTRTFTASSQTSEPTIYTHSASTTDTQIGFSIYNTEDKTVTIEWVINQSANNQDNSIESGSDTISGQGFIQVSASGLDSETTYYCHARAQASSEIFSDWTTLSHTTNAPAQTSTPGTESSTHTHYSLRFIVSNNDTQDAEIEWEVRKGSTSGTLEDSGSFTNVSQGAERYIDLDGLAADTTYYLVNVYATADSKTKSNPGTTRSITTDEAIGPMTTPSVSLNEGETSGDSVTFDIKNPDEENADIDWEIATEESGGTVIESGTLTNVAAENTDIREVSASGMDADDTYWLRNVIAKTRHEDGTMYRPDSSAAGMYYTRGEIPRPGLTTNANIGGAAAGRGADFFNFRITNHADYPTDIELKRSTTSWGDGIVLEDVQPGYSNSVYVKITAGITPNTTYTFQARATDGTDYSDIRENDFTARYPTHVVVNSGETTSDKLQVTVYNLSRESRTIQLKYSGSVSGSISYFDALSLSGHSSGDWSGYFEPEETVTVTTRAKNWYTSLESSVTHTMGTGSGGCLANGTPILMADGSTKFVQDLNVGDKLKGYADPSIISEDEEGWEDWTAKEIDKTAVNTVTVEKIQRSSYHKYYLINKDLRITIWHRILAKQKGLWCWRNADELRIGDYLLTHDGRLIEVGHIDYVENNTAVTNIVVGPETDTYYAGKTPIVVHNGGEFEK